MKKILLTALLFCFVVAEDEFFEAGTTVGGYGELHYTNSIDPDAEDALASTKLDFHRYILFVNHNFTPEWSLKSELEIEHNMIDGDGKFDGEVELEQAYINYHNSEGNWGAAAGVILMSAGIINETHEPPTFLSVERPSYNKYIIPTTWFGNGAKVYGKFGDFSASFTLHEDMAGGAMVGSNTTDAVMGTEEITTTTQEIQINDNGTPDDLTDDFPELVDVTTTEMVDVVLEEAMTDYYFKGLRDGRAKGYKSGAYHWTKNIAVDWTGMEGVRLGGSFSFGGAPTKDGAGENDGLGLGDYDEDYVSWNLFEIHGQYDANNVIAAFEYGTSTFTHEAATDLVVPEQKTNGYYFHLGYNVADMMGWEDCKLVPWFGMESYDLNDLDDNDAIAHTILGLTWWPTDKISWKVDYDMKDNNDSKKNSLSLGVGYMF